MKYAIICLGAFATFLGFGVAAHAQSNEISYSFIEAVYQGADVSTGAFGHVDGDGPRVAASLTLGNHMHLFGNYEKLKLDDATVESGTGTPVTVTFSDLDRWGVGFGFHTGVFGGRAAGEYRNPTDRYSVFFDGQYISADPNDSDGWAVDAGFRAVNFTSWEFIAAAGVEKLSGLDSEFTLEGRLMYNLVSDLQVEAGIDWNDNVTRYFFGLRYNFPKLKIF
jgi:hypothetical protein